MLTRPARTTTALLAALFAIASLFIPALAFQPGIPSLTAETPAADQTPDSEQTVTVSLEAQRSSARPGDTLAIAVIIDHKPGWHTHTNDPKLPSSWKRAGFRAYPTAISIAPADAVTFGPAQWPAAHEIKVDLLGTNRPVPYSVFEGRAIAFIPVVVAPGATPGDREITVTVSYQVCDDHICLIPTEAVEKVTLHVDAAAGEAPAHSATFDTFDPSIFAKIAAGAPLAPPPAAEQATPDPAEPVEFDFFGYNFSINPSGPAGVTLIILVGFLGGLILNLTPCVLPVIPIKIIGLQNSVAQHGGGKRRALILGGSMFLGIVAFWLVIGVLIAGLRTVDTVNQMFGNRWFLFGVAAFIGAMAFGMLGAFEIRLPSSVSGLTPRHDTTHGSFLFGVMTAILGIPCFGPFAGAVTAWATQQPIAIALTAFVAIGIGMALPYLILAINPRWVSFIPRTGPASELVKQVMGLLLLATGFFFLGSGMASVLATDHYAAQVWHWWVISLVCLGTAFWLVFRTFKITRSSVRRAIFVAVALLIAGVPALATQSLTASAYLAYTAGSHWKPYSPQAEAEALAAGKVVVTDFTAIWCLNCKLFEARVLAPKSALEALTAEDVVCLIADLSDESAPGWQALKKLREIGIPVVSFQGPGIKAPHKIRFGATSQDVVEGVSTARGPRTASSDTPAAPLPR
jgi:thiol:disulfide interchange protein